MNYIILKQCTSDFEVIVKGAVVGLLWSWCGITMFTSYREKIDYVIQSPHSVYKFVGLPQNSVLIWSNLN